MERKESRSQKTDRVERGERGERRERGERDKDRERKHRSSHAHRSSSTKEKSSSRTSLSSTGSRKRSSAGMPDLAEESSVVENAETSAPTTQVENNSRTSTSYPAFSKEHSKEAVGARPDLHILSPPSTDINASKEKLANLNRIINNGPPSPPLTDQNAGRPRPSIARPITVDTIVEEEKKEDSDSKTPRKVRSRSTKQKTQLRDSAASSSPISRVQSRKESTKVEPLDTLNTQAPSRAVSQSTRIATTPPQDSGSEQDTVVSSAATSIAPEQPSTQRPVSKVPSPVVEEEIHPQAKSTPIENYYRLNTPVDRPTLDSPMNTPSSAGAPPPPPPPPHVPVNVPRVDYLLQNGGLTHTVPRNLLYAGKPMAVQQSAMSPGHSNVVIANLFEPFSQLLTDFEKVMAKNGSLAVATGYRSVARRLLDRLEAVFARDLSAEICTCTICRYDPDQADDIRGVSWGEILELVSGRKDLPSWPPFAFVPSPKGLGLDMDLQAPMQKLDIDVPEEYREHYIRQSQKTKQSVDKWLNRQTGDDPTSPPSEVDDETLTFAILTHIPQDQRALYKSILGIVDQPVQPPRRAPSPEHNQPPRPTPTPAPQRTRPDYLIAAGLAIKRLYRLAFLPRDPETAIYLLNNPSLHHPLATLSAVSNDEWDILISGRFDGFLRSGAEEDFPPPAAGRYTPQTIRMPSRGATPAYGPGSNNTSYRPRQNSGTYNYPRPSTAPGYRGSSISTDLPSLSNGRNGPIALDEETEIAALAEIERDIYTGMESLEDAFEALHLRAEAVRRAIRERSAGLAAAQQRRKQSEIEIRAGTPGDADPMGTHANALGNGGSNGMGPGGMNTFSPTWDTETDDGLGDDMSELFPDDSASNISSVRRRKHKRRNERRTPVVGAIDEEGENEGDEEYDGGGVSTREASPEKREGYREGHRERDAYASGQYR